MRNTILITLIVVVLGLFGFGVWYIMKPSTTSSTNITSPSDVTQTAQQPTVIAPNAAVATKTYTLADVSSHSTESDCWLVISNKVYNVTSFIPSHPGGQEILKGCGKDATQMFSGEREHAENNASALLPQYYIGDIFQ